MKNTTLLPNPKKQNFTAVMWICIILCALALIMVFTANSVLKTNLDGNVVEHTGVIKTIDEENETVSFEDGVTFSVASIDYLQIDWQQYVGKTVTIVSPAKHHGDVDPWTIGLKADGKVVADYNTTIINLIAENKSVFTGGLIASIASAVLALVMFVIRGQIEQLCEYRLQDVLGDSLAQNHPSCPDRKTYSIILGIVGFFTLGIMIGFSIYMDGNTTNMGEIVFGCLFIASLVAFVATAIAINIHLVKAERKFYAQNFPFDLDDISHLTLRKKVKQQLMENIAKEKQMYPHVYGDGGNGYDVEFSDEGVKILTVDESRLDQSNDVFDQPTPYNTLCTLSYEQLHFEAIAHYRKNNRPFCIMIKSRLQQHDFLPEDMQNDLYFALDVNLLKTLSTFGVEVENLQHLLDNVPQLIAENCPKAKNKLQPIQKNNV